MWYLLGGSGVTCPRGVVAGVGGFNSPAASVVELLPEDRGVCGPWREPPEFAGRQNKPCYSHSQMFHDANNEKTVTRSDFQAPTRHEV